MRESKPICLKNRYKTLYVSSRDWKPLVHIPTNRKDKHLGYNISNPDYLVANFSSPTSIA